MGCHVTSVFTHGPIHPRQNNDRTLITWFHVQFVACDFCMRHAAITAGFPCLKACDYCSVLHTKVACNILHMKPRLKITSCYNDLSNSPHRRRARIFQSYQPCSAHTKPIQHMVLQLVLVRPFVVSVYRLTLSAVPYGTSIWYGSGIPCNTNLCPRNCILVGLAVSAVPRGRH